MLSVVVKRKSDMSTSYLQVDENDTILDVVQMAMFDIGTMDLSTVSVSTLIQGANRYLDVSKPLSAFGFKSGDKVELLVSETPKTKLMDVISKFKNSRDDPETQRLEALDRVREETFDAYPEMFMPLHMLYLNVVMNGQPIHCLVDTGAHGSTISIDVAEKCGLTKWIDTRVKGKAVGVGEANLVGIIYNTDIHINGHVYPISLSVLDQRTHGVVDFLFGLDMLRRHGCIIDLNRYELKFGDGNIVSFLSAKECEEIQKPLNKK